LGQSWAGGSLPAGYLPCHGIERTAIGPVRSALQSLELRADVGLVAEEEQASLAAPGSLRRRSGQFSRAALLDSSRAESSCNGSAGP
jgi:hypothetical protein